MTYWIEQANREDLLRILDIYASARAYMAASGNPSQWGTTHPPKTQLETDIARGRLYVAKSEGAIRGVFYFCMEQDPTYAAINDGGWHSDLPYGVIHRIASDGSGGIVKAAVAFALKHIGYLRIDTHADNHTMQRAVAKAGFVRCGTIYIADGSPRIAYDLIMEKS